MPYDGWTKLSDLKPLIVAQEEWTSQIATETMMKAVFVEKEEEKSNGIWFTLPGMISDVERTRQALRLVQEARARIGIPGVWIKGRDHRQADVRGGYQFCARGVIVWLGARLEVDVSAIRRAISTVAACLPYSSVHHHPHTAVANYNDDHTTSLDDVLRLFDRAADVLQMQLTQLENRSHAMA